jgi:hypothetical protein
VNWLLISAPSVMDYLAAAINEGKRGISTVLTHAYFRPQPFQAIRSSVAFAIR